MFQIKFLPDNLSLLFSYIVFKIVVVGLYYLWIIIEKIQMSELDL